MGLLDATFRGMASSLINLLGATAVLRRVTITYNTTTNASSEATASFTIMISPPVPYNALRIDGTLVLAGDAKCLAAAADLETAGIVLPPPSNVNWYLDIGSDKWNVVRTSALRSGDQSAAIELQLRR